MFENLQAVIFDCDGTLVDSEALSIETLVAYGSEFGLQMEVSEAFLLFAGGQLENAVAEIERRIGTRLPDDFIPTFRLRQADAFRTRPVAAVDGARDLLANVQVPYCLASNAPRKKIDLNLELTGLEHFFDEDQRFSADDRKIYKPDPDLFHRAVDYLQTDPENCAVVEDSQFGIDAGLAAGMRVFVYAPHGTPRFSSSDQADRVHVVQHLSEHLVWPVPLSIATSWRSLPLSSRALPTRTTWRVARKP